MKKNKILVLSISILLISSCARNPNPAGFPILKGDYLGQKLPGSKPVIFAPGVISTGLHERDFTISPDGNEIYYSLFQGDWNTVMMVKRVSGVWQEPVVAPFARDTSFYFAEATLASDGNKIFFFSTKPRKNEVTKAGWANQNIWVAERQSDGSWAEAKPLPENINAFEEFYPSITNDGTLYFCRTDPKTNISQILRSKLVDGQYQNPIVLPAPINGKGSIFNACIAPDDSYLIGGVYQRDSSTMDRAVYMLFFHNADDTWRQGVNLVKELNLPCINALSASVTPDGKYLFFSSSAVSVKFKEILPDWKLSSIVKRKSSPGSGDYDIYWMRIEDGFKQFRK